MTLSLLCGERREASAAGPALPLLHDLDRPRELLMSHGHFGLALPPQGAPTADAAAASSGSRPGGSSIIGVLYGKRGEPQPAPSHRPVASLSCRSQQARYAFCQHAADPAELELALVQAAKASAPGTVFVPFRCVI